MNARLQLLSLLLLLSCAARAPETRPAAPAVAPAPAPSGAVAHGRGYSVPVPAGFLEAKIGLRPEMDSVLESGGLILIEAHRPKMEHAFLATVVVTPVSSLDIDPGDPATCSTVASQMGKMVGAEVQSAKVVELKVGKTCQWRLNAFEEPNRGCIGTVIPGPSAWVMTCNHDVRDAPAQEACEQALAGWQFDPQT